MRFSSNHQTAHSVDLLFSLALFLLFAVTGISIVLFGTQVYRSTTAQMEETYTSRTALCYVSEKVRQTDVAGGVSLLQPEGFSDSALVLHETINGGDYDTYIYFYEGVLRELFVKRGTNITPEQGTVIVSLCSFTIEEADEHCYILSATEQSGKVNRVMIRPKSI